MSEPTATATATDRRRRFLIPAVLIGLYVIARIVILIRSDLFPTYDTTSYAPTSPVKVLSFTGHSPRPWGVPLLFTIMPNNEARAIADWTIGTLAWATLAYGVWLAVRSQWVRIVAVALVLLLALTPALVVWDFAILSESLSISLGVLALGLLMIWARTRSKVALAAMVVAAFWWTFTRQDVMSFVGVLVLALLLYVLRDRSVRKVTATAALVLVLGMGWHVAMLPALDQGFSGWGKNRTLTEGTFFYRLRFIILPDAQMRSAYWDEFQMPRCPDAEQIAKGTAWRTDAFQKAVVKCPDLMTWIDGNASSVGYRYALRHPQHFASSSLKFAPSALAGPLPGAYQTSVQTVVPEPVARVFWPDKKYVLPAVGLIAGLILVVAVAFRLLRRRPWLYTAGFALVALGLANTVLTLLYTAGEYARFGIQEAVFLRIGLLLIFIATLDALVMRHTESAAASSADAPSPDSPTTDSPATAEQPKTS